MFNHKYYQNELKCKRFSIISNNWLEVAYGVIPLYFFLLIGSVVNRNVKGIFIGLIVVSIPCIVGIIYSKKCINILDKQLEYLRRKYETCKN